METMETMDKNDLLEYVKRLKKENMKLKGKVENSRCNISSQMRTEKKHKSAEERLVQIEQFHWDLQMVQRAHPQVCPIWGAFPPAKIWNADHIPLPFSVNLKRSLNTKGSDCWIVEVGPSGLDKRQATLHLW
jgi:hypothetical protein